MYFIRSVVIINLAIVWSLVLAPLQVLVLIFTEKHIFRLPRLFHKGLCRLLNVQVTVNGHAVAGHPTLFVINHISWLDIPVVGSALEASFIAKQEIEQYPAVGTMSKLQKTLFIARTRPAVKNHKSEMQRRLDQGHSLILFPEGTSSNGVIVKKFNSAFFALAQSAPNGLPLVVQPVSLGYSHVSGFPLTRTTMGLVAWVGDQSLASHIWDYLKSGRIRAELRIHEPVTIEEFDSRKAMALSCHATISRGLSEILTGQNGDSRPDSKQ